MEETEQVVDPVAEKTLKLAKLGLLLSVVSIAMTGFVFFKLQGELSEVTGINLQKTIKGEVASNVRDVQSALQTQVGELESKVIELKALSTVISDVETKMAQFEVDSQKNDSLRAKVAELEARMRSAKVAPKPAAKSVMKATPKKASKAPQKKSKKKKK